MENVTRPDCSPVGHYSRLCLVVRPQLTQTTRSSPVIRPDPQESLDVTLAYLKGNDAESEEAQEHANSSSLALYA